MRRIDCAFVIAVMSALMMAGVAFGPICWDSCLQHYDTIPSVMRLADAEPTPTPTPTPDGGTNGVGGGGHWG